MQSRIAPLPEEHHTHHTSNEDSEGDHSVQHKGERASRRVRYDRDQEQIRAINQPLYSSQPIRDAIHNNAHDIRTTSNARGVEERQTELQESKIRELEQDKARLLQESLSAVDRFSPEVDDTFRRQFIGLNKKIGPLAKRLAALTDLQPPETWETGDHGALWPGTVNKNPACFKSTRKATKLLLRQMIWKFIAEMLINRRRPFASFHGKLAHAAINLDGIYNEMLQLALSQHEKVAGDDTDKRMARWRIMTVQHLEVCEDVADRQALYDDLEPRFAEWACPRLHYKDKDRLYATSNANDKLVEIFKAAVELTRLIIRQRAGYSLEIPSPLYEGNYEKREDPDLMTNVGSSLGVDEASDELELSGVITLLATPAMVKWGNGIGDNLEERTTLAKAVVEVKARDEDSSVGDGARKIILL